MKVNGENVNLSTEVDDENLSLSFTEKILRSNTNNVLSIPNLTYLNYTLNSIKFDVVEEVWEFEVALRSGGTDFAKLLPAYFRHHQVIDISPYSSKISEGDKLELVVKPKHCPKDINLKIEYTYSPSQGALYYQNTIRLTELDDPTMCTLMSDISQHTRPTRLEIKVDSDIRIKSVRLEPKFASEDFSGADYIYNDEPEEASNRAVIDFTAADFPDGVLNLLQYYRLSVKLAFEVQKPDNLDTPLHFLAYGFKVV